MLWWIVLVVVLLVAVSWGRRRARSGGGSGAGPRVDQASVNRLRRDWQARGFDKGI